MKEQSEPKFSREHEPNPRRITLEEIENIFERGGIDPEFFDAILLDGYELAADEHDSERRNTMPIEVLGGQEIHLSDRLLSYVGQKVLVISESPMVRQIMSEIYDSDIVFVNKIDLSRGNIMREQPFRSEDQEKETNLVETYAEFPKLLKEYLLRMERLKSLLKLISETEDRPEKESLRSALMKELEDTVQEFAQRNIQIDSLPKMNMQDLKLNLAGIMSATREDSGQTKELQEILRTLNKLRRLLDQKHEFSIRLDVIPEEIQSKIDQNNLVLAALETEARYTIVEKVKRTMGENVDGFVTLGSAAWGSYFEVKESSDVDTEIMFGDEQIHAFGEQVAADEVDSFSDVEIIQLLKNGNGKIFDSIRALIIAGYVKGEDAAAKARDALKKFGVFAELRRLKKGDEDKITDKTGYENPAKIGDNFADYMSYKVHVEGVPVSIHVVASEAYQSGCNLDLKSVNETHTLHEVRIGARKKVSASQKEKTSMDAMHYPDKLSFDGEKCNYRCNVSALVRDGDNYVLHRPSQLEELNIDETDVLAWVTPTPIVVVEDGRMYHGLFQDKVMWGSLDKDSSAELLQSKRILFEQIIGRFVQEVEEGFIEQPDSSLLQLTSRFERIPAFTKRRLLMQIKTDSPELFKKYKRALEQVGSKEMEVFKL